MAGRAVDRSAFTRRTRAAYRAQITRFLKLPARWTSRSLLQTLATSDEKASHVISIASPLRTPASDGARRVRVAYRDFGRRRANGRALHAAVGHAGPVRRLRRGTREV